MNPHLEAQFIIPFWRLTTFLDSFRSLLVRIESDAAERILFPDGALVYEIALRWVVTSYGISKAVRVLR